MHTIIAGALAALLPHAGAVPAPTAQVVASTSSGVERFQLAEDLEARIFDLRGLSLAAPMNAFGSRTSILLPLLTSIINENGSSHVDDASAVDLDGSAADVLVEAFLELQQGGPEFEIVEVLEGGLVYLVGSGEMLDEFDAFVTRVAAALTSNPTLEILEFQVSSADASALPEGISLSGQVERTRLLAWLAEGVEFSRRQVLLAGGGIHMVSNLESHTVTTALEAEIAQASSIFRPKVYDAVVGSELTLSGYRSEEGVHLRYMAKSTELRESENRRRYTAESRFFPEGGQSYYDRSEAWSEDFGMAGGHSVGSAQIDAGHYLMLSVGTSQGHLRCIAISLDPDSLNQSSITRIAGAGALEIVAVPWGLMQPAQIDMEWNPERRRSTLEHNATDVVEAGLWTLQATAWLQDTSPFGLMLEHLEMFGDYHLPGTSLLVVRKKEADRVMKMADLAAPGTTYHVSVMSQDPTGRKLQRGSVSIEGGTVGALVAGHEQLIAKGADIEVAQFSATRQPVPNTHFDGLALMIKLGTAPDGSLLYGLRGQVATDLEVSDGSAKLAADSALTAVAASQLFIHETGTAAPGEEPGTWTIVVGDETQAGAFVKLTISAE